MLLIMCTKFLVYRMKLCMKFSFLFVVYQDVEMQVMLELIKFDVYNINYISLYNLSNFLFPDKQLKC